jgi:hypothetical protein
MFAVIQLIILVLFSILILSFIKSKISKTILLVFFSVFISAQYVSLILGGNLIDYKFYQHLNFETIWAVKFVFIWQTLKIVAFGIFVFFFLKYISSHQYVISLRIYIRAGIPILCFVPLCLQNGIFYNILEIYKLENTHVNNNFNQSINTISGSKKKYVISTDLKIEEDSLISIDEPKQKKNIIVISMESLEKAYLSDELAHLTPNLRRMAKEMTFYTMKMGPGSDWTAGSIYTEMTGFPSFFKNQDNEIFQGATSTKISSIGHILQKAGYDLTYAMASSDFGGIKDMLTVNKFKVLSDADFSKKNVIAQWGTYDKDLFREVKKIIKKKSKGEKPFGVFMSTISTHPPDGVYDQRMEKLIPKQKTNLEFMVAATDYFIHDLMLFLKNEKLLDNTVIYLFPDHLLMGTESDVINRFPKDRSLFLLTNAPKSVLSYPTTSVIYQIDIPKIILEGAEVKHNAVFFTDLIAGKNKLKYIDEHKAEILAINESSLVRRKNIFFTGQKISINSMVFSNAKAYNFIIQKDGNLVIYKDVTIPIWESNTAGTPASILELTKDGNLVLKDNKNIIYWSTNTSNNPNGSFTICDDGVLRVFNNVKEVLWESSGKN